MSGKTIVFRPRASRDFAKHMAYLEYHGSAATANRFEKMLLKTLTRIQIFPELGSPWESDIASIEQARFRMIERFRNHIVFYSVVGDTIDVIRVLHSAQNLEDCL
jgi:plasmid stabilization system protein ParE